MAFPTMATSSKGTTTSGTTTVTSWPASAATGDLMLLIVAEITASVTTGWTGWTKLNNNSTVGGKFEAGYKTYTSGDTAPTIGTMNTGWAWIMLRITEASPSAAPELGTFATSASGQPNPPSYSPSWGALDTLWIATASATGNAIPSAAPTNYTLVQSSATVGPTVGIGHRQLNAASEDPGAFAGFSGTWNSAVIAVSPVSGGAPPNRFVREAVRRSYFF